MRCLTEIGKQNKDQTDAEIHVTLKKLERQGSPDSPEKSDTIHGAPKEKICLYVLTQLHEFIIKLKFLDAFIHSIVTRDGLKNEKMSYDSSAQGDL